jgi:3'-phosphoadenosine 5'-phosphosulfate (PAPS) 3'-phosphatase
MDKAEVIASVAGDLNATEQAVDAAIAKATTLIQSMIGARTALSLSPVTGADAQAKAMEAIAALSAARSAIVASHEELAKDHRRMGWGPYAIGVLDKPPETGPEQKPVGRLRAV